MPLLRLIFDLDRRAVAGAGHAPERLGSAWLYQALVRLALASLENDPWVELAELARLDGYSGSLASAGRKLSGLLGSTVAGVSAADLIIPKDGIQKRGPYRLAEGVEVEPAAEELRRYIGAHQRSDALISSVESWIGAFARVVPRGATGAVVAHVDAILRDRIGRSASVRGLLEGLVAEPEHEVRALARALHDPEVSLERCAELLVRAARQEFGVLRGLAHALLLVRGALPPHDGLAVLERLGHDDAALARMLAHAILLRVVTRHRVAEVQDLIFTIADFERERHRAAFLARDLGIQRGTYHPLAPAGVASILVDRTGDLGYVDRLLARSLHHWDEEVAVRCVRDAIWLGIFYPTPTFKTLAALPGTLPPSVEDALATTLAIVAPHHGRLVARFVKERPHLADRVRARHDDGWSGRYGLERRWGADYGKILLDSPAARSSLAATVNLALAGRSLAEIVETLLPETRGEV